jgi:hypothetical protein
MRATNSPLTFGMHHDRFCQGFSAFFFNGPRKS